MRYTLVLFLLVLTAFAQGDDDCLIFTDSLLENGDLVQMNIPVIADDSDLLLEKFIALQAVRHFLIDALREPIPCHEEPTLSLLDATIGYQDYVTLRLGQKLVKDAPSMEERLVATLEAADSSYDAYDTFWNPPDA